MKSLFLRLILNAGILFALAGCQQNSVCLEPDISYIPKPCVIEQLPSSFEKLSINESKQDWGKEFRIGLSFARESDHYRAITALKRAVILLPPEFEDRRMQIDYSIMLCYYLGGKCQGVITTFEDSPLASAKSTFPAFRNLLLMIYDCYLNIGCSDKASGILDLINKFSPATAKNLILSELVIQGALEDFAEQICGHPDEEDFQAFLYEYRTQSKSVKKAQTLNAVLPGAGYYYVGQKKTALTSFIINALFTAAAYELFDHGYVAAGLIVTSLEFGWYVGGINGAGLAAKEYNEAIYNTCGKAMLIRNRMFPILMFEKAF